MDLTYIWSIAIYKITLLQESEMRPTGWTLSYIIKLLDNLETRLSSVKKEDKPGLKLAPHPGEVLLAVQRSTDIQYYILQHPTQYSIEYSIQQ